MSHENMYVAEKELCSGTLIELEKLNDVKGIGRRKRKERPPPPQTTTVLECSGGVMRRVQVTLAAVDPTAPSIADGAELLDGLTDHERRAVLLGEAGEAGEAGPSLLDFSRPTAALEAPQEAGSSGRAPAPSWARRRTGHAARLLARQVAEAETDEEDDRESARASIIRRRDGAERKERARSHHHLLSFDEDEP
jgi:hypothetical protein